MALKLEGIEFAYGKSDFSLEIEDLSIPQGLNFLIGRNGSGKSTLLNLLACYSKPSRGTISGIPARVGYVPQRPTLPLDFNPAELLEYVARLQRVPRSSIASAVEASLREFNLDDCARRDIKRLSGGMRRRLAIACATVHRPELIVLDEPTNDLDPVQRGHLMDAVRLKARDATVIVSTHFLHDVARVDDTVVMLDGGEVEFVGTVRDFLGLSQDPEDGAVLSLEAAMLRRTGRVPT